MKYIQNHCKKCQLFSGRDRIYCASSAYNLYQGTGFFMMSGSKGGEISSDSEAMKELERLMSNNPAMEKLNQEIRKDREKKNKGNLYIVLSIAFFAASSLLYAFSRENVEAPEQQSHDLEKGKLPTIENERIVNCPKCSHSESIPENKLFDILSYTQFEAKVKSKFGFQKLSLHCRNCNYEFMFDPIESST